MRARGAPTQKWAPWPKPGCWRASRLKGSEFPAVDARIDAGDDLLLLPLLSQRDPRHWAAPDEFRPGRWDRIDPETHPGYLPFGHASERCWGRHRRRSARGPRD
ncbi:cytochrome P450 [Nocardia sp. NPDC057030]|uniref:cytochrome P450 n=1 Tax=unclassified Nocardia TaxID=2637762 RepID=UPI003643B016